MNQRKKIPTINEVAEAAGVSKRTVSRVINRSDEVNAKTRARVEEVIRQLNFAPNRQARGLASRRSYLIGLVYDVPTLFIADIQKGILDVCFDEGFELFVHACHIEDKSLVSEILDFVSRTKVDGIIVQPPFSDITELSAGLHNLGCHYVQFSSELSTEPWKQVVTNYLTAITDMTNHLVNLGHTRFGFISGPKGNLSSKKRQESFVQALKQHRLKLPRTMVVEGAFTYESGERAAEKLLSRDDRPTAIFAANDEMAFGVMSVASKLGIRIPEDLSLVGFDGTPFSHFVTPSLSTIRRQPLKMAQLATQKLIARINEGRDAARAFETMVSPQFVPRDSTGPAPEV
jgi:LacI family transcriptional regulator